MRVDSWISASTVPGAFDRVPSDTDLDWNDAVPPFRGSDDDDHWFRTVVEVAGAAPTIELGGLATVCDVYLDGERVLRSESMFLAHELPVAPGRHELAVCARALTPVLAQSRRPRARWRTRVVADGNLRWVRTSFFGRAPGFAPEPPLVGPWRPVELRERPRVHADVRTVVDGRDGVIAIHSPKSAGELEVVTEWGTSQLAAGGGQIRVTAPEPWWPHTHGDPALHLLRIRTGEDELVRRVGFRRLAAAPHPERDGLDLHVNGVPVFARGAVWTPVPPGEVRATLERARDGGLNLIRVVGTMMYESVEFHDACDELGLLVWQDMMFANLDYPFVDESFTELVEAEARQGLREIGGRPSLAVVCGNSEIEQQVAMLGLAPELAQSTFFSSTLPSLMRESGIDAQYIPSAPCGGTFPFRTNQGVANYFGVGAYMRPLEDVRRADVQFASECLAFANVPDEDPSDRTVGVMRDAGADWDFADVRDHYLAELYGIGPDDEDYWGCRARGDR